MKIIIIILLILALFACNNNSIEKSFKIESMSFFEPLKKLEMNVIIQERFDKIKLEEISNHIKNQNESCDIIMIFFYTPDLEIGKGSYAVATFNPNLDITIQRATEEENNMMVNVSIENATIIGKWKDNTLSMERTILIYSIHDTLKMRSIYKDKSFDDKIISKVKNHKLTRYNIKGNPEEWYILEENGNLSTHGVNGKYNEMKTLP